MPTEDFQRDPTATSPGLRPDLSAGILLREELVETTRERLLRHGLPRLQMSILVALTGAAGFLSSYVLLQLGLESMAVRYPLAVAVAYGVFLLLLRVWLYIQRHGWLEVVGDGIDLLDVGELVPTDSLGSGVSSGGGTAASGPGKGFDFNFGLDLDEGGCLVLVALLIVAVTALGASLWLVWSAPVLLAEVLVDGLLMTALYRRLKRSEEPAYWLFGAVRRTWISAVVTALLFSFAGGLLHRAAPDARSIGAAWKAVSAEREAGPHLR